MIIRPDRSLIFICLAISSAASRFVLKAVSSISEPRVAREELISIEIDGHDKVYPIANEDLPRSTDEKTSSVHFLRFEFDDDSVGSAKNGADWYIHCEHLAYKHTCGPLKREVTRSLLRDFL